MHHPAEGGIAAIERQMGSGIGRGSQCALHNIALQIHYYDIVNLQRVIGHAAGLDGHQPTRSVDGADVTPGKGHQAVARQIQIGV